MQFIFLTIVIPAYSQNVKEAQGLELVDTAIARFMYKWSIPQGSVAIVKEGKLVYSKGFGKDNSGRETFSNDLFRIASLSKPITATAVMRLIDEGKLDLESPVFGEFGVLDDSLYSDISDSRVFDITIKHLLQHAAGWDREISGDPMFEAEAEVRKLKSEGSPDPSSIIQYIIKQKLDFTPGTKFAYSNFGYSILGRVIETVSGVSYEEYVKSSILFPLQIFNMQLALNNTPAEVPAENPQFLFAKGTSVDDISTSEHLGINIEAMDAHGGWMGSASDVAKFVTLFNDGPDGFPVLSDESKIEMMKPSEVNPIYGLGWFVNKEGNCWHTGSLAYTSAFMAKFNNGIIGVILFNARPEENSKKYFSELDKLLWSGIRKVNSWPTCNLFNTERVAENSQPQPASDAAPTMIH